MKNLLLCGSLLIAGSAFSQVLSEDFEGIAPGLPAGWTSAAPTVGGQFYTGDASDANAAAYWPVNGGTNFAMANDDVCNCNMSVATLVTPSMNFAGLSGVVVQYDFVDDMSYGPSLPHEVEVSINGGSTWTTVYTHNTNNQGNLDWATNIVPLGAATDGAASVMVRWVYDDNGTWATGLAIDNVVVKEPLQNDISLDAVSLDRWALINSNTVLAAEVTNVGGNTITSLEIDWNDGTSHVQTVNVNIAPGGSATVPHPDNVTYASAVEENISVSITAVNGTTDGDPSNNSSSALHNTLSQLTEKAVVIEEGTGTWCGWCPRGTVAMEYMTYNYPNDFIGIAVHNGDPMTVSAYDNGAAISGFPGANVDRAPGYLGVSVSSSAFEQYYNERIDRVSPADIEIVTTGAGTANQSYNVSATFRTPIASANLRLAVVVVEDGVTGTGSQYAQANYYSSSSQNIDLFSLDGTNWKNLANPVPAADMVYDHVGRALLGGYNGQAGSVPTSLTDGQVVNYTFNYTVPGTSNANNIYAVALLIDQNTGEIVNAASSHEGAGLPTTASIEMKVYPNPTSDVINVGFEANGDYFVTLTDLSGRVVYEAPYNNLSGSQTISVNVQGLTSGNYILGVSGNGSASYEMVSVK